MKPGASARLYETYRDYAIPDMTYELIKFRAIIEESRFAGHYRLVKRRLGGLSVWIEIRLYKQN